MEGVFETELRACSELGWLENGMLLGLARESKIFARPSIRITGRRKGWCRGVAIAAVVAAELIWMIVCF
jgi:hypothetical protein